MDYLEILKKVPLFKDLDSRELMALRDSGLILKLPKDKILFYEGDKGDSLYLILKGKVKAFLLSEEGREITLSILGEGELVGEMALFDVEEKRTATVMTLEDSEFFILSGDKFIQVVESYPKVAINVIKTLSKRLKITSLRIRNLIFLDTYSKVGRFLLDRAKSEGRLLADGSILVTRPKHEEIASFIGTSRETVSRALKELEHQGLIKNVGKKVILYKIK